MTVIRAAHFRTLRDPLVPLALAWVLGWPIAAAPPQLYTQPELQSPVRGEPDDLLMLPGFGFASTDVVVYRRLTDTTLPLVAPAAVPVISTMLEGVADVVSQTDDGLVVHLPTVMTSGQSYALWVRTAADEWSDGVRINDARPLWLTPPFGYETAAVASLPRQLKVVGRNLQAAPGATTQVRLNGPAIYTIDAEDDLDPATSLEHYVARVPMPVSMQAGSYSVEVRRDGTSWVPLDGQQFTVLADPQAPVLFDVSDAAYGGCAADDGSDDAACIEAAIAAAEPVGGVVSFGPGRWDLKDVPDTSLGGGQSSGILVPEGVGLLGAGAAQTMIVRTAQWGFIPGVCTQGVDAPCVRAVFTLQGSNTVSGIHFEDEFPDQDFRTIYLQLGKRPWWASASDPDVIEDVVIVFNHFTNMHIAIGDGNFPLRRVFIVNNELQAYRDDVILGGNSNLVNVKFNVEDSVVAYNLFYPGDYFDPGIVQGVIASQIGAAQRVDFSDNVAEGLGSEAPPTIRGHCSTLPSGCGWRAAHFWHMNNNHEKVLISRNYATCTGDKTGDGEAIVFDNNRNDPGFDSAEVVTAVTPTSVTVGGSWRRSVPEVPTDYYTTYWVQIADGKGLGQTRKVVSYTTGSPLTIEVSPPWDVEPEPGSSKITVLRQYWQLYVVDNEVDIRGCEKNNTTAPRAGVIYFHGMTADSTIEGNVQYESDGVRLGAGYSVEHTNGQGQSFTSWAKHQYFVEVRGNQVLGEYNFNDCEPPDCPGICCNVNTCCVDDCDFVDFYCDESPCCSVERCCVPEQSWSGIELLFGSDPDSPSPAIGFGVSVAHNTISRADALRSGAISIDRGWWPPPTAYQFRNTLIHHNTIRDLKRLDDQGECLPYDRFHRDGGVGIHIEESYTWNTVLYANDVEDVCYWLVDFGTDTEYVPTGGPGVVPTTLTLDRVNVDGADEVRFTWSASACSGAEDYAIYEGTIGDWYSHVPLTCQDTGDDRTETLSVSLGGRYYLVVPHNPVREGSYGADLVAGTPGERPVATPACAPAQELGCP